MRFGMRRLHFRASPRIAHRWRSCALEIRRDQRACICILAVSATKRRLAIRFQEPLEVGALGAVELELGVGAVGVVELEVLVAASWVDLSFSGDGGAPCRPEELCDSGSPANWPKTNAACCSRLARWRRAPRRPSRDSTLTMAG